MSAQTAQQKGWYPTPNFYAGSQIWRNSKNKNAWALYSPACDHLSIPEGYSWSDC